MPSTTPHPPRGGILARWRARREQRRDARALAEVREIVDTDAWLADLRLIDPNRDVHAARKGF